MMLAATQTAIDAALAARDIVGAARLAEAALARGEVAPMLLNLAAWAREEAADYAGAHALIDRAIALAPDDVYLLTARGEVLLKEGRLAEAVRTFDGVIHQDPGNAAAWLGRAVVLETGSSLDRAAESFAQAARLDPQSAAAFAGKASVAGRLGKHAAARADAARALALDPAESTAHCALARSDIEEGEAARAVDRLRALLTGELTEHKRILALSLLGDALAKLRDADGAFAAYSDSKARFGAMHADSFAGQPTHTEWLLQLADEVRRAGGKAFAAPTVKPVPEEAGVHVVLAGFPRSGTTLVENILASAAGVEALEERPTLRDADRRFYADLASFRQLGQAGAAEIDELRVAHWRYVTGAAITPGVPVFVDMDPLKGMKLPLISRMFPKVRIVIMRRDPRDVVWSCFRANFALTPSSLQFTTVESTARNYAAMMTLIQLCIDELPLTVHQLRYDRLVADFDATTQALCDFIGINWSPALRAFNKTAEARGVGTLSVSQVRKPLYDGGGQWRRFETQMAPALPILAPWVEKFGFLP